MVIEIEPTSSRWNLIQFCCVCVYTIGFGGFTSFPYYVHKHTGLFLVAYYILAVVICIPLCYVQLKLGSLFRTGIVGISSYAVPILKGSGFALLFIAYSRCILHGVDLSYGLFYLFASTRSPFMWKATENSSRILTYSSSAERYLYEDVLQLTPHLAAGGTILWYLLLTLLASWLLVYLMVFRGSSGLGKLLYVLSPLAIVLLVAVLIYGHLTIPNSGDAMTAFFSDYSATGSSGDQSLATITDVLRSRLGTPMVWIDALWLHIQSIGLWSGVLPTLGSHINHRKAVVNTAWMSLLVIYSIVPHIALVAMAPYMYYNTANLVFINYKGIQPGLPLLFVTIPNTFSQLDLCPAILACFYLCFVLFGLIHQAIHILTILENFLRGCPRRLRTFFRRDEIFIAVFVFVSFLLSLAYTSQCGFYLYLLVRDYFDRLIYVPIILCMIPLITAYVKQESLHLPIERACMSVWFGVATLTSATLLIYYFVRYVYPVPVVGYDQRWAEYIGWCVAAAPVLIGVSFGAIHAVRRQDGPITKRIMLSMKMGSDISDLHETDISNVIYTSDDNKDVTATDCDAINQPVLGQRKLDVISDMEVSIKPESNGNISRL